MKYSLSFMAAGLLLLLALPVSAHVVVKPSQVGVAAFQTFTMGVPSEKPIATTSVRLVLPDGLSFVTPNVKPGWKIEVKKESTGKKITDDDGKEVDEQKPTEILWSGSRIPAEQRDEFVLSARVPKDPTTLIWKAYQTYADGSVVAWDADPKAEQPKMESGAMDFSHNGPYSQTVVVDDLAASPSATPSQPAATSSRWSMATLLMSALALIIAVLAFLRR